MDQTNTAADGSDQPVEMTLLTMMRGVSVRVSIASVFIVALFYASYAGLDRIEAASIGGEIRVFSLFGIAAIIRFFWVQVRFKSLIFSGLIAIGLTPVTVFSWDFVPGLPDGMDISFLSMLGIVFIQHPLSLMLLRYYQYQQRRTRERIKTKLKAIRSVQG